ncbi:MAG: carbonic anhydrase [Pseudobdellovibrio sp.]
MRNKEILKLIIGFRRFREKFFNSDNLLFDKLTTGQTPKTLIIACSDSRVDPALMASADPGDLFVIRNVANLVPPYESAHSGLHGVSAAIEFAVKGLKVENIVILGHRQCGGIRALVTGSHESHESFVGKWMSIAESAKKKVLKQFADADLDTLCRHCEMESISVSLDNLKTFPFIIEAIASRQINIVGIYFDLEQGQLFEYDETSKSYSIIQV